MAKTRKKIVNSSPYFQKVHLIYNILEQDIKSVNSEINTLISNINQKLEELHFETEGEN
jgi:hypothetical protein